MTFQHLSPPSGPTWALGVGRVWEASHAPPPRDTLSRGLAQRQRESMKDCLDGPWSQLTS
jgi:hypothetical protein